MLRSPYAALAFALALTGHAQTPEARDTFEVASINPSAPLAPGGLLVVGKVGGPGSTDPGQIRFLSLNLHGLIRLAYAGDDIRQIVGADAYNEAFDVTAKVPTGATQAQSRRMLQNLLADRFGLVVHRETREMPAIALLVADGGPKLPPSTVAESAPVSADIPTAVPAVARNARGDAAVDADGYPLPPEPGVPQGHLSVKGKHRLTQRDKTLAEFAETLSVYLSDLVVDQTGLTGRHDCSIVWANTDGPTIYDAVRKLGLKLQPKRLPVNVLVVDHANRQPTAN